MNWVGNLIQKEVGKDDTVLELGCGIMQHLLDFVPTYPKTRLHCKSLTGVDIEPDYLVFLEKKGVTTVQHDLTKIPVPFADKTYDVVLLVDVLEHLPSLENAEALIGEAVRIAKKKIIVFTPSHFREVNPVGGSWENFGFKPNEYQRHRILLTKEMLTHDGFKVRDIKDKAKLHHLYGVRNLQPSFLKKHVNSIMDSFFESRMEAWRRRHGVLFEDGFSVGKVVIGKNTFVSHLAVMNPFKDAPIIIGDNCTVKEFCDLHGNLKIGNSVRIACGTIIITTGHNYVNPQIPIWLQGIKSKGVIIEDDCWIGAGCIILDGVVIRKGSVIGAGSLIPQNTEIPPYSVAVGNPVHVIKHRGEQCETKP